MRCFRGADAVPDSDRSVAGDVGGAGGRADATDGGPSTSTTVRSIEPGSASILEP